jgi:dihydroflavonol-4-reductase
MKGPILVTGASGFIGSHCVLELLDHGYAVRGTVRDLARADPLRRTLACHTDAIANLELVAASLTRADDWPDAVAGCTGVLHVASPVPTVQPKNPQDVIEPARMGTLNVLTAAARAGAGRAVFTSSGAAIVGSERTRNRTYSALDWSDADDTSMTPYSRSKTLAERTAWQVAEERGLALSVVNPVLVLGPALEADYGSSLEVIYKLLRRELPLLPKFGFEIVDVRDVAVLHRLALERPEATGQRLIAAAGFLWFRELAEILVAEFPAYADKIPTREMPNWLARVASLFIKELATLLPDLDSIKRMDVSPARSLGWQPRSPQVAIVEGARSLIALELV